MTSTASERRCECGQPIEPVSVLGIEIPLARCPDCAERELREEEVAARVRDETDALARAGANERLLEQTLDGTDPALSDQLAQVRAWLAGYRDGERQNLWLSGNIGTGKTWVAWGVVRELALDAVARYYDADEEFRGYGPGTPALFVNWRDLLSDMKDEYRSGTGSATGLYGRACRVRVLALDDLGAERPTPWALESLAGLVQARYDGKLPTIVTSNFYSDELAARIGHADEVVGKRIVSRLVEGAVGVRFEGDSRRRRG